ncbi:unnamed protein product [Cladocopium goreaui]|uniref:SET domain-containing protein 5 n=1 Tax=Cladocopium goreaui TaxID=2562237 RepID=A0A9P1DIZ1_9DINO|nr:unnamed protein product [Cladocopium goreaui]
MSKPRITIRQSEVLQVKSEEEIEEDQAPEDAKVELLQLLGPHPHIREVLRVPRTAQGHALIEALSIAPNKFEALRHGGLSLADAVKVLDLLELALQAQPEQKARRAISRSAVTRICLPCLFLTELLICGLLIYTLETATGGWEVGKCSLVMFTNITCTEQTTRCAVDVEVRSTRGTLRFFTKQGWHLPVTYKTEMGGFSFASYLGERLKCCNDPNGRVGPCCDLMESTSEIFCDNLALLGQRAWDGTVCPSNGWDCLFLIDDFDPAKAADLKFYTPPDLLSFIIAAGVVALLLVLAIFWSLVVRFCDCTGCMKHRMGKLQRFASRNEQDDEVEVTEVPLTPKPTFRASMTQDTVGTVGEDFVQKINSARMSSRKRGVSRRLQEEEELVISPELGHVPQALLTLPGVVQELETVMDAKKGEAARNQAVEEECRKYLKWEAHEKPLTDLEDDDIHPHFKRGNLNRFVVMAEQATMQKKALMPLIEPRPPSAHFPQVPGSNGSNGSIKNRPGTANSAGRGTPQAWGRPGSAKRRPASALADRGNKGDKDRRRPQSAQRPGSAMPPMMPPSTPARIEVSNL